MQSNKSKNRPGFTLVELAVVIGIIALLAGILLPAIYSGVTTAKVTRVGIEIASIGKALERYKLEFGEYPPDFSESAALFAVGNSTDGVASAVNAIDSHLSSIYRRRGATTDVSPPAQVGDMVRLTSGNLHQEFLSKLNPTNALVFWLSGFTSDPQLPVSGGSARTPFFEFDKARFAIEGVSDAVAVETSMIKNDPPVPPNGFQTSMVSGYSPPGITTPYVYYNATSYPNSIPLNPSSPNMANAISTNPAVAWAANTSGIAQPGDTLPIPYLSTVETVTDPGTGNSVPAFIASGKFQIIAAGLDGNYGGPMASDGEAFNDNICSFTEGRTIEDFLDEKKK